MCVCVCVCVCDMHVCVCACVCLCVCLCVCSCVWQARVSLDEQLSQFAAGTPKYQANVKELLKMILIAKEFESVDYISVDISMYT